MLLMEDEALEEFEGINTTKPNAVVVGLAPSKFNYEKVCLSGHIPLSMVVFDNNLFNTM